jgi:phenylacetic acid degradation operon negative regulatory protein
VSGDGAASPQPCPGTPPDTGALGLRPLTARSVILSVLLGSHPPVLPVRSLVRTAALFGINEGTTRVALSRLAGDGDVVGEGRQYRLNDRLIDRQRQQDESRAPATRPWRGRWEMVLLEPAQVDSALQAAVGAQLTRLKLGEFRPGVWMRPANLRRPWPPQHRGRGWYLNARTVLGGSDGPELAARIWDLTAWVDRAEALLQAWAASVGPAPRFVLAAALVRHLQADPILPAALLPAGWPGSRVRDAYAAFEQELGELLRRQQGDPG